MRRGAPEVGRDKASDTDTQRGRVHRGHCAKKDMRRELLLVKTSSVWKVGMIYNEVFADAEEHLLDRRFTFSRAVQANEYISSF